MRLGSFAVLALVTACSGAQTQTPAPAAETRQLSGSGDAGGASTDAGTSAGAIPHGSSNGNVKRSANVDPSASAKENRAVAKTLARVSELRGITPTRAVPGVKLERAELVGRVKDKALREYPADALRREGQLLQLMGFAPPTFDYLGEMMRLLEAQLEGFYEPKNGTMYLASDLHGPEAQATLAHELVHALQDMRWDLRARSTYKPGKGDESMALGALAEGDATSAMFDFILLPKKSALDLPEDMIRELMKSGMNVGDLGTVPHILKTTLVAPYAEGLGFVHALRRKGGWDAVNRAWDRTPTTTEQILHVDKWEANEGALTMPAPTGQGLGEGWKKEDEDTFGELGFALTYGEWMESDAAREAAAGWGGDRSTVFSKGDEIALAVHERYDAAGAKVPDAYAERAMSKLVPALKKHLGKPVIESAGAICFERKETGPLLFARKDRDLVMIAGPAKVGKTAWTSTSTCAAASAWSDEVLAQR